jgi:hypothetical protein
MPIRYVDAELSAQFAMAVELVRYRQPTRKERLENTNLNNTQFSPSRSYPL